MCSGDNSQVKMSYQELDTFDLSKFGHKSTNGSFKEKINQYTIDNTRFIDAAAPYNVGFRELDNNIKVIPQLEQIDFYGGHRLPEYEYVPESVRYFQSVLAEKSARKPKSWQPDKLRRITDINKIMNSFGSGQLCFVGPAGIGKSTLLKFIAREVLHGRYANLKEVEVVHYIQCKDLRRTDKVTIKELLFHDTEPNISSQDRSNAIAFALKNPQKVLFVLDSLDTLLYTVDGVYKNITHSERASSEAIMWNFLAGKFFSGSRIITSSREHSIRYYMGEVRAQSVFALVGLTTDSMKQIIRGYLGEEEAEEIMQDLEMKSPSLQSLCRNPVFLVYTLIGRKSDSNFVPSTMSGIMALVLRCLMRSPHALEENIEQVVEKLKQLAFTGAKEQRVLFRVDELAKYQLHADEVRDLTILAPGLAQKVLIGSQKLFFSHQSFQEYLSALFIAQMHLEDFSDFLITNLHTPHYAVIRRFLCGILLDNEVLAVSLEKTELDTEVKQNQLKQSFEDELQFQLQEGRSQSADRLELLIAMHEADEGMKEVIESSMQEVEMRALPLSASDVHAIASVVAQCNSLEELCLEDGNLDSTSIKAIWNCMEHSDVKISTLNVGGNENMGADGFLHLGKLIERCEVKEVEMYTCDIKAEEMKKFNEGLGDAKMKTLDIFNRQEVINEEIVLQLLPHIDDLLIVHWEPSIGSMALMQGELDKMWPHAPRISFRNNSGHEKIRLKATPDTSGESDVEEAALDQISTTSDESTKLDEAIGGVSERSELEAMNEEIAAAAGIDIPQSQEMRDSNQAAQVSEIARPVNPEGGKDSEAMELQAIHEKEIIINKEGGTLTMKDCNVIFPPNAFHADSVVRISSVFDSAHWPKEYIGITSTLFIELEAELLLPVTVQMMSWCVKDGSRDGDDVNIEILHKPDSTAEWNAITTMPLSSHRQIEFHCQNFSPVFAAIRRVFFGDVISCVNVMLFVIDCDEFHFVFSLDNVHVDKKVRNLFKHSRVNKSQAFNKLHIKQGDTIKVGLKWETSANVDLVREEDDCSFTVDERLFTDKYFKFNFINYPKEPPAKPLKVTVKPSITINGVIIDPDFHNFRHTWSADRKRRSRPKIGLNIEKASISANQIASGGSSMQVKQNRTHNVSSQGSTATEQRRDSDFSENEDSESDAASQSSTATEERRDSDSTENEDSESD